MDDIPPLTLGSPLTPVIRHAPITRSASKTEELAHKLSIRVASHMVRDLRPYLTEAKVFIEIEDCIRHCGPIPSEEHVMDTLERDDENYKFVRHLSRACGWEQELIVEWVSTVPQETAACGG